ncbi:MAG: hypothetical protein HKN91_10535 [Acidimicrobiia bacterium]|nr:hypothetical protein [Acidimicrobiia bacterium]
MTEILLTLHIIAAGTWIGASVVQLVTSGRISAQGGAAAASWHETAAWWGKVLYSPAAVVILATGVALVLDSTFYEFSNAFVSIGFLAVIAGAVLGITKIGKGSEQAAAAFAAGDDASGLATFKQKVFPWAVLDSVILLIVVLAMVGKWGAGS